MKAPERQQKSPSQAATAGAPGGGNGVEQAATEPQTSYCSPMPTARDLPRCGRRRAKGYGRIAAAVQGTYWLVPSVALGAFLASFVGWDILTRYLFPNLSTAVRHTLLTIGAILVTMGTSGVVYLVRRRQRVRLSQTAERLTALIHACQARPTDPGRFENPHLVHCRAVMNCTRTSCPMYDAPGKRCWEVMAQTRAATDGVPPRIEVERCLECEVYARSCPDKLTELGESFNSLMFLLEAESQRSGQMRAQMLEKEKMVAIGQMAAGIAHEVCNPLSSISSVVQMLKRKHNGKTTEELDLIERHIQRITGTVRKLTSLAHPGADRWEPVDVSATLEEVVRLVAYDRRARKVNIKWQPGTAALTTYAVRDQLQQVFINLALNALDAMPHGGELTVQAEPGPRVIRIRVEDTGCGIPPEVGRRVFEPFFTTKPQGQGTGLGLAVSYGIIQKHQGRIDFESRAGQGTTFQVELPVLTAPPDE